MLKFNYSLNIVRFFSSSVKSKIKESLLLESSYSKDEFTNINDKILSYIGRNLHLQPNHPLGLVRQRIVNYFYKSFLNSRGNPLFSVHDNLYPVVNVNQNFDSLLIPKDHVSRQKSDCYYINKNYLLRAHMTAHQSELIKSGLNDFLMAGDVYRRDEIDNKHYPVFHQMDGVRLKDKHELFGGNQDLEIFEKGNNTVLGNQEKQECHSIEAVKLMEHELKSVLVGLAKELYGKSIQYRWVDTYFPFTQPSWELEVFYNNEWMELLGCGIIRQPILAEAGSSDRIGWAFGIGLERVAMCLYKIPDIRLFWSQDTGFLNQFNSKNLNNSIVYKPVSQYPQCKNDISFWVPNKEFCSNDFYDLVRNVGGDLIEQVTLVDNFTHPKTGKTSHCYKIIYRHMEKTLTQEEVNIVHKQIENSAKDLLNVVIR